MKLQAKRPARTSLFSFAVEIADSLGRYGIFSQIKNADVYDGSQLLRYMDEIKSSGAVLVAHIMPTGLKFRQVGSKIAADIANVVKRFTDEGIEVWLRFGHEMNYYAKTGYYNGSTDSQPLLAFTIY